MGFSIKDYHKNIGELLVRIKDVSEEEAKKRDEVIEKAEPKAEFFRLAGAAILAVEPDDIGASWQGQTAL